MTKSLDQIDREHFDPGPAPLKGLATIIDLLPDAARHPDGPASLSLDGGWIMAEGGSEQDRLGGDWSDALPAAVPGSIQTALLAADRIPDPYVGKNDEIARAQSFKTWWLLREFDAPAAESMKLVFGGICDSCAIWLNGEKLGEHKGMFAPIAFDVSAQLAATGNKLIVRLDPAPQRISQGEPNDFFIGMNVGWLDSVVINNIYGWHYINLPSLGIWRSVSLGVAPEVAIVDPFVGTLDAASGRVRLHLALEGQSADWAGCLRATVAPENFAGPCFQFAHEVNSSQPRRELLLEFTIPDAKAWWPVDHGEPNLYRLTLSFTPGHGPADRQSLTFGIRTIEMRPLPSGPDPDTYNWTFVVNGKAIFIKGANWCTIDALLRFERERYERFLHLARDSHIQLLRAWGSGMPETDEFYDLADRCGVMVLQEWPTAWNSHAIQPYDLLEETVRHNTLRLRNHPSLVMWGGGNESSHPTGPAIDMMGRHSAELDGTRAFHRGEPWGGSIHSYDVYWGRQPLDRNLSLTSSFIGEFGLASPPILENVRRYLPPKERETWPPPMDGSFIHHLPVFNLKGGMAIMAGYVADFLPSDCLENFVTGMQMAQATGMRHTLELARTRWPGATGVAYYKLTDNNPAASWSTVDWHGAPKIAYHILRGAYRPLHACLLFQRLSFVGVPASLPLYLLDDAGALAGQEWKVTVRAFDAGLAQIKTTEFRGSGGDESLRRLGDFELDGDQTWTCPLLIVCEIDSGGAIRDRVFYWLNYTSIQGCLFDLPRTQLTMEIVNESEVRVSNIGDLPAVAVHFDPEPGLADRFSCGDSYFWLDAGEERILACSPTRGLSVKAWNSD